MKGKVIKMDNSTKEVEIEVKGKRGQSKEIISIRKGVSVEK